ncbi:maltotransferase domain-containing protein [Methylobacterium dankookense]|uniref:Alpha-1,4-glucan:maltose-1-phosphate maltosyltransferase n=1 Tax=Methylobacterium dankookense TaxID=560405 RepID=A0A564FY51_9HYPH|nr:maltotransferase domain-containing protein [Methylobacterium dankookense]GJD54233.1 Alpha-1,4-glucan:maltose-1-phosphate maltosyltransferase [Methylobacterium dankookense]VUF12922.1 Alpha-1,4-glucan:maltose-1-phosphate maltosyltransferase 1 [Methylobacterium dankookense]
MNAPTSAKTAKAAPATGVEALPAAFAPRAEGPRIYNLFPLLVGRVSDWTAELPRIAGLGFDWVYLNPFHQTGGSGSLYAVADPDRLDERFRDQDGRSDDDQIRDFCAAATAQGLGVMTDLVVNHAANDGRLARERPDLFAKNPDGSIASPFAVDPDDPDKRTVWGDLAEFDYHSEQARAELTRIWSGYVAHLQGLGVAGFRCDAAYMVPADTWRAIIAEAKARDPESLFAAETLGCTFAQARDTAGAGFDYLFNSFAWWDLKKPWALEQYERLRVLAPSIAFPENHDMGRLAAEVVGGPAEITAHLRARYALAAFFSAGVLMPIGYEWGYRRRLHVVDTTPAYRESDTGIDISAAIAAINRLRAELPAANVEGAQASLSAPDSDVVALIRYDTGHHASARSAVLVLYNPTSRPLPVDAGTLIARTGGLLGPFVDRTPEAEPIAFHPGSAIDLAPGELRIIAAEAAKVARLPTNDRPDGRGRVVIEAVTPELDGGRSAVKRVVGESLRVEADIFSDGHEIIDAAILSRVAGTEDWRRDPLVFIDNDRWGGQFPLERNARYEYTIEAWRDGFFSWMRDTLKKRDAGVDIRLETIEGVTLVQNAADLAKGRDKDRLAALVAALAAEETGSPAQLDRILQPDSVRLVRANAERVNLTRYPVILPVIADRLAARFSAWYEIFPRSQSMDPNRHGTFRDVIARLPEIRELGFDVLYFTPIHPVGRTNRKGKNNTLKAEPGDVGSVYAVGAEEGGHEAVHPDLGTFEDFAQLVAASHAYGMEIALDFAIQCSPDHPWIKNHPEWFEWRPDGTLKFAENPPKKYEDISNVHFYGGALPSLWIELRDILLGWCARGVRIFRVDNPHTKPIPFWEWVIGEVNGTYPDAIFLAEAFTRPKMMKKLAKAGYQQSYTYFTWRNTKQELTEYALELAGEMGEYYRPNFFANTPDINPYFLQTSGRPGFVIRATLAATLSSVYGIYNGFEMCEAAPYPGKEEYLNSEKYELKAWDYHRPGNIREHVIKLNQIRRENPALWDFRNIHFTGAFNENIIAFAKVTPARDNCILVMVNLDPRNRQECTYEVPLWLLGLPDDGAVAVEDLLQGYTFELRGKSHRIALDPAERSCIVWRLAVPRRVAG